MYDYDKEKSYLVLPIIVYPYIRISQMADTSSTEPLWHKEPCEWKNAKLLNTGK